jgi:hypothetical protein
MNLAQKAGELELAGEKVYRVLTGTFRKISCQRKRKRKCSLDLTIKKRSMSGSSSLVSHFWHPTRLDRQDTTLPYVRMNGKLWKEV